MNPVENATVSQFKAMTWDDLFEVKAVDVPVIPHEKPILRVLPATAKGTYSVSFNDTAKLLLELNAEDGKKNNSMMLLFTKIGTVVAISQGKTLNGEKCYAIAKNGNCISTDISAKLARLAGVEQSAITEALDFEIVITEEDGTSAAKPIQNATTGESATCYLLRFVGAIHQMTIDDVAQTQVAPVTTPILAPAQPEQSVQSIIAEADAVQVAQPVELVQENANVAQNFDTVVVSE